MFFTYQGSTVIMDVAIEGGNESSWNLGYSLKDSQYRPVDLLGADSLYVVFSFVRVMGNLKKFPLSSRQGG